MPDNGKVMISRKDGVCRIKVSGRATFDCAPPLRDLSKSLEGEEIRGIQVDLKNCEWMDSTFMGCLAMLGLRARKSSAPMEICSAGEENTALLAGLGLKKLFLFTDRSLNEEDGDWIDGKNGVAFAPGAEMVLEAHKTLMGVDEKNVEKFEKVVDLVQKDIDKLDSSN